MAPGDLVVGQQAMLKEERDRLNIKEGAQATALCLSGGGVRSAAFCLGVLQTLANRSLLHQFNYLSTVSGGGYIGAFLRRAIAQKADRVAVSGDKPPELEAVLRAILQIIDPNVNAEAPESPELRALRRNTSFLAPDPGLASLDTWAGVVLWLRNTLINWTVFLPLLIGATSVAVGYAACADLLAAVSLSDAPGWAWPGIMLAAVLGVAGLGCFAFGVYRTCVGLPSHCHPDAPGTKAAEAQGQDYGLGWTEIRGTILRPLWIWVFLAPLAVAPLMHLPNAQRPAGQALVTPPPPLFDCRDPTGCVAISHVQTPIPADRNKIPWWVAFLLPAGTVLVAQLTFESALRRMSDPELYSSGPEQLRACSRDSHSETFERNRAAWTVSALGSGLLLALGIWLVQGSDVLWLAVLGPLWVMLSEILRSTFYVALRRFGARADLDREWLARLSAAKLQLVLVVVAGGGAALALPLLVLDRFGPTWSWLVTAVGVLTGPIAALIGKSAMTTFAPTSSRGATARLAQQFIIMTVSLLFGAASVMVAGRLVARFAAAVSRGAGDLAWQHGVFTAAALGLAAAGIGLAVLIDGCVNLNRFSMHAVYRNRLVRGFLGSARAGSRQPPDEKIDRHPDRFTQFDPADNLRLVDCWRDDWRCPLFPVFNMALNETVTQDAARQERKAISFTMSPLHCGAAELGGNGAYVRTESYAGADRETGPRDKQRGVTLGTAMTISGAAVSPNMGYQSSPALAFIMTLFNVRLGAWLPNPVWGKQRQQADEPSLAADLNRSGPDRGLMTLLRELTGQSSDQHAFAYLSDGGHFDNLGVYEMLRRRCRRILVIDAGRDQKYAYADLGHALQRARIDFGTTVEFVQPLQIGDETLSPEGAFANNLLPRGWQDVQRPDDLHQAVAAQRHAVRAEGVQGAEGELSTRNDRRSVLYRK